RRCVEAIRAQSFLFPWAAKVVRTITMQRQCAGYVFRADSGWEAVSPGDFNFSPLSAIPPAHVHRGAVPGVYNIRRIREQPLLIDALGVRYRQVLFDADV